MFKRGQQTEADHHYTLDLLPDEREAIIDAIDGRKPDAVIRKRLLGRLRDAVKRTGPPLPPAALDWAYAEQEARERGESVPDWMFDRPWKDAA